MKSYKSGFARTKGGTELGAGTCCTGLSPAGDRQVDLLDTHLRQYTGAGPTTAWASGLEGFREGAVNLWSPMSVSVGCAAQPVLTVVPGK